MANSTQVIFHQDEALLGLGAPDHTLVASTAAALRALPDAVDAALARGGYRFACGLIGYRAGAALLGLGDRAIGGLPPAVVHLYRSAPVPYTLAGDGSDGFTLTEPFRAEQSAEDYHRALTRIRAYLAAGDCYQVNFAQRFQARWRGDARAAFERLYAAHPAPHACFFRHRGDAVFGVSPERFLSIRDRQVVTEPIKGSRPRGASEAEDRALGDALRAHPKDRAENLMIVDLLRNDLGRFCEAGSIHVSPLFELRRFSNVQHLVSTVTGQLAPGTSPLAALLSAFPGGSITGAPKQRAMQIIHELEPAPRGAYCGSLFWQDDAGRFDSNILIRTLQTNGDRLYCHGGGGIVYDSDPREEYEESWFKVRKLMEALDG